MKSKYNFLTGILICMLIIVLSCTDMLDIKPDSLITNESFWNTEDDANGALSNMYVDIRNQANENLFYLGESRSEVMEWGGVSGTGDLDKFYNNTLNSTTSAMPNWLGFYETVNTANLIIKYVPDIPIPIEASKNNILAQAYTMRAFVYFVMARTWGGVPLRINPTEGYSAEITQKERATEAEVFTLIKNDLEAAISLFEDNKFPAGRNRWSKAAAYALKADVYLWTGKRLNGGNADFSIAVEACNEVQKADVNLLPNFADLFEYTKKGNKEVIMAVGFKELEPGSEENYFHRSYSGKLPSSLDPINGDVIGVAPGSMVWNITELVRNQFTADDTRRNATFAEVPSWPTLTRKGRGVMISGVRYYTSDIVFYRYADVLLMKAEAKNALGQDPSAEINMVRQRAYGAAYSSHVFVNGSKAQNDEEILKERLLELVVEGKRWWDLVRFEKAFDVVPSLADRNGQDYLLLWPISLNTLSLEPQVQQNPGW